MMQIKKGWVGCTLGLLILLQAGSALAAEAPLALVWRGPGVCKIKCGPAAAKIARKAGFRTLSVYPGFDNEEAFREAKLWVQPGGKSVQAAAAMGPELMARLRRFVADGGGYVGFCAGMFLASDEIGTSGHPGLGIIPGGTELFLKSDDFKGMVRVKTNKRVYGMYYAGGPMLHVSDAELKASGGEVIATYKDGSVAGIAVPFGSGRVAVVGTHPEATWYWKILKGIIDTKGEGWFAAKMMRWATSLGPFYQ